MNIGRDLIGPTWDKYKSILNDAHATFNQKAITWQRYNIQINRYQEDIDTAPISVELLVLLNYNYRRSWPITLVTESGQDDEQSIQIFLNKEYLRVNDLLDSNGAFQYNQDYDRFIIDGITYAAFGDTAAAQMQSDDVFFTLIVKRVQIKTGTKR